MPTLEFRRMNRGEWGDLFALLWLCYDGKLALGDPLNGITSKMLPIDAVIRNDGDEGLVSYHLWPDEVEIMGHRRRVVVSRYRFGEEAFRLQDEIREGKGRSFTLSLPLLGFLEEILVDNPKGNSLPWDLDGLKIGEKSDLLIETHEPNDGKRKGIGLSIKSEFAGEATLQNGSQTTNFLYRLDGIGEEEAKYVNSLYRNDGGDIDLNARCNFLREHAHISCEGLANPMGVFRENLKLIAEDEEKIFGQILLLHYFGKEHQSRLSVMPALLGSTIADPGLRKETELKVKQKIAAYLFASFSGMVPTKSWSGERAIDAGYLHIGADFQPIANLAAEQERFQDYLLLVTRLEHASSRGTRADYGYVFNRNGCYHICLNLQIRFAGERFKPNPFHAPQPNSSD